MGLRGLPILRDMERKAVPLWGVVSVTAVVLVWGAVCAFRLVQPLYLPSPLAVVSELVSMIRTGELWSALSLSLYRIITGFAIGVVIGILVGLAVGVSRFAESVVDPLLSLAYPIPKIALLPLIILWMGIGESSKIAIIAVGVFFPMAINTIAGVTGTDKLLIMAAVSLGASPWQIIRKVLIMNAIPVMFAGLRIAAGQALLLIVSAEMVAATAGIGYTVLYAGDLMMTAKLMAGLVVLCALGILSTTIIQRSERLLFPWRRY